MNENDSIPLSVDNDLLTFDDCPDIIASTLDNLEAFSGNLKRYTIAIDEGILDLLTTQIDTELQDSDDISVSVGNKYNPESSVLSRPSRETVNNNTDLFFYPGINPATDYIFISENRAINPNTNEILIQKSSNGNQFTPKLQISSIFGRWYSYGDK